MTTSREERLAAWNKETAEAVKRLLAWVVEDYGPDIVPELIVDLMNEAMVESAT